MTNAFIPWLQREIDERADGSIKVFARLLTMSETAVREWTEKRAKPSRRGCKNLGRVTGMPWRWIGQLAGSRYIGGVGNGAHEADLEPEPFEVDRPRPIHDKDVFERVYPGCDGCDRFKHRTSAYLDRQRYYCRVLVDLGLPPLCFSWSLPDVWQAWRVIYD